MIRLRVGRSPLLLFLLGLTGLVLALAAVDVVWGHWLSTPPALHEGVISTTGRSQRRADAVWGLAFFLSGGLLFVVALAGLLRRRPAIVVTDDGLEIPLDGPAAPPTFVSWGDVVAIRSETVEDPGGGGRLDAVSVETSRRGAIPAQPWGAWWEDGRLVLDAEGWDVPVGEVVVHAQLALDRFRRGPLPSESG